MIAAAHQPLFIPWIGYFHKIEKADLFVFADNVQYTKSGWIARNKIKSSAGAELLSVPVKQHRLEDNINEIKICNNQPWKKKQLKSLTLFYSRAPYFREIYDLILSVYDNEWNYLSEFDIRLINTICSYLNIKTKMILGSDVGIGGHKTTLIIDICKKTDADTFLTGMGASTIYIEKNQLELNNIICIPQNFMHPEYPQLFGRFIPNLSVLDLLFNKGKGSIDYIKPPENYTNKELNTLSV